MLRTHLRTYQVLLVYSLLPRCTMMNCSIKTERKNNRRKGRGGKEYKNVYTYTTEGVSSHSQGVCSAPRIPYLFRVQFSSVWFSPPGGGGCSQLAPKPDPTPRVPPPLDLFGPDQPLLSVFSSPPWSLVGSRRHPRALSAFFSFSFFLGPILPYASRCLALPCVVWSL